MRRGDLLALAAYMALAGVPAAAVLVSGEAWLPRHSAARDLPWSRTAAHAAARDEPLNHGLSDAFNLIPPDRFLLARRPWPPPLWNDAILGGVPHLANPLTGAAYPPNWLLARLDPLDGLVVDAALHAFLLALFLHLFLRRAGLGPAAACVGGVGVMLSGWVAAHAHNTPLLATVAWVPAGLFALETRARGGRVLPVLLLPLSVGLMWSAGFPQLAVYGSLALLLYGLAGVAAAARARGGRAAGREVLALAGLGLLGLALAGPQLASLVDVLPWTGHQDQPASALVADRYRDHAWVGLAAPTLLGDPMHPHPAGWRHDLGAVVLLGEAGPGGVLPPAGMNWSERTVYPGLVVLLLALLALLPPRGRPVLALAAVGAAGVLLAAVPGVVRAAAHVPGLDVGQPARAVVLLCLALPALAGFGAARLARAPRAAVLAGLVLVVLPAAAAGGFAVRSWRDPDAALLDCARLVKETGVEARLGVEPRPAETYTDDLRPAFRRLRRDATRATLVLVGAFLALAALAWGHPLAVRSALPLLVLVTAADLASHLVPANLPVTRTALFERTPGIRFLQEHLGHDRFVRAARSPARALEEADRLLVPNLGVLFGLRDAQGYRELVPQHYVRLWEGTAARVTPVGITGVPTEAAGSPVLDLARVRYLVASEPLPGLASARVFPPSPADEAGLFVYENEDPLPVAWWVPAGRAATDEEARARLLDGSFDPRAAVLLHDAGDPPPAGSGAAGPASVAVVQLLPEMIELETALPAAGWIVLSETWMPGWTATVSTRGAAPVDVPVRRANGAFRAVRVPAEATRVTLAFRPAAVLVGTVLAACALALTLLLALLAARGARRRRREPAGA